MVRVSLKYVTESVAVFKVTVPVAVEAEMFTRSSGAMSSGLDPGAVTQAVSGL